MKNIYLPSLQDISATPADFYTNDSTPQYLYTSMLINVGMSGRQ